MDLSDTTLDKEQGLQPGSEKRHFVLLESQGRRQPILCLPPFSALSFGSGLLQKNAGPPPWINCDRH